MSVIRLLPSHLINQIAAGEVIERPAAAVKELVENALDAGATEIDILLRDGGKSLISVKDNGKGMDMDELHLAVQRHATSKLPDDDLFNIKTLGFRGEALPSIAAVSRLDVISSTGNQGTGWALNIHGGDIVKDAPIAAIKGTKIDVRDLFFATPARLKFLKTDTTELQYVRETIEKIAIAHPEVRFVLRTDKKNLINLEQCVCDDPVNMRLGQVLGTTFSDNTLPIQMDHDDLSLSGYVSIPTYNSSHAKQQYIYVNGRPVKDKVLSGAVRAAYQDFLSRDRHPILCLFVTVVPEMVDINVHPAKSEVRFRAPDAVRRLVVSSIKRALTAMRPQTATTISAQAVSSFIPNKVYKNNDVDHVAQPGRPTDKFVSGYMRPQNSGLRSQTYPPKPGYGGGGLFKETLQPQMPNKAPMETDAHTFVDYPLGAACAQLHNTYIVAQNREGLVVIDQHAAHERLVYERMKAALNGKPMERQVLLIPEVVDIRPGVIDLVRPHMPDLAKLGLVLEEFGDNALIVREVPGLLSQENMPALVKNIVEDIEAEGDRFVLQERLHEICSSMACHGSVRAGRVLSIAEMNDLLRQMENIPHASQCNHGRPTHAVLKLKDMEKLFGRT